MTDARLVAVAAAALGSTLRTVAPDGGVAVALADVGVQSLHRPLDDVEAGGADAIALLADELSTAGEHAEELVATLEGLLRPGGLLVASVLGAGPAAAGASAVGPRRYTSGEFLRTLGHRGFAVETIAAPGAAARLHGDPAGPLDAERDRWPGLLDAADRMVAVARIGATPRDRTSAFFDSVPRKVVAAAVVCLDDEQRLLVVHDSFKQHWTIPGGVVDPDEDPRSGAVREAWEEAGVRVRAGRVIGVFAASWPDRIVLLYEATPDGPVPADHGPLHAHEIDDVAWVALPEALELVAPFVAEQVRLSLGEPGGTFFQHRA